MSPSLIGVDMNQVRFALLCALSLAAVPSCNEDTLGIMSDLSLLPDLSPTSDMAMRVPDGVSCGQQTCNAPQVCCIRAGANNTVLTMCSAPGTCGDGGAEAMCDGPEDCAATSPNCCATAKFMLSSMDAGAATPTAADSSCLASCVPSVDLQAGELHTKLCHVAEDCVGYAGNVLGLNANFDGCCTSQRAPNVHFCAPKQYAGQFYTCK